MSAALYDEVCAYWTARGKPELGRKVARAWEIVDARVQPRDGRRVLIDADGDDAVLDSDPNKVIDGMPEVDGDRVFAVLLGDLDANTYREVERIEVTA